MAIVSRLEVTNIFADDSTLKVTINDIRPENINPNIENIRSQVIAFNNNSGGELSPKMKSKNGYNWVGIKKVRIVTTDTNYIF